MATAKLRNPAIIDTKTDYTNGARWFSTILKGRNFPRILTSTAPLKGKIFENCSDNKAEVEAELQQKKLAQDLEDLFSKLEASLVKLFTLSKYK